MPRTFSSDFRNELEAPGTGEVLLCFATLTHESLSEPVRVVADVVDYIYGSQRFYGVPFDFVLPSDGERPPRAKLRMQNVDQRIGTIVLTLSTSPRIKFEVMAGSDFGDATMVLDSTLNEYRRTRQAIGTPTVEYSADYLRLANVAGDAMMVEADIESWDLTREPWPSMRATRERFPGLYR